MDDTAKHRLEFGDSLARYWPHLIGISFFPAVWYAGEKCSVPSQFFGVLFIAVAIHAGWPYVKGNAPSAFWLFAMLLFAVGGVLSVPLGNAMLWLVNTLAA